MSFHKTLKAISDPIRRDILVLLKDKNMSVGEIGENFQVAGSTLSYHLSQLKKAGLIFETKEKNFIYYQLNTTVFEEIMLWFTQFEKKAKEETKDDEK